jgi:Domain of unknown function (DUF3846)
VSRPYTAIVIEIPDDDDVVHIRRRRAPEGDGASLRFMQGIVGGYIEHLGMPDGKLDVWLNEEGKLEGLPINDVATNLLWQWDPRFRGQDVLVGNVVLTGNKGPETWDVPEGVWENLQKACPAWLCQVEFVDETDE